MVRKCCETCGSGDEEGCCKSWCTRSPYLNVPEEKRDVDIMDVGIREPSDRWTEGESTENILFRIRELEKKMEGI